MITCDPPKRDVYEAIKPRMVVEVLSPSNAGVKWDRKLNEYRRHELLDYILLIDSGVIGVTLYTRTADGWESIEADALGDVLELERLGCKLPLAEIYEGAGLA